MKKISKTYYLILWVILFAPALVQARVVWTPGQPIVPSCARVASDTTCGFYDLITLINTILDVFIWITVPISTVIFAMIGWNLIVEGDKSGARSEAKKKMMSMGKGLFAILAAYIIVKMILNGLLKPGFNVPDLLGN